MRGICRTVRDGSAREREVNSSAATVIGKRLGRKIDLAAAGVMAVRGRAAPGRLHVRSSAPESRLDHAIGAPKKPLALATSTRANDDQ